LGSTGSWTDITGAVGSTFTLAEAQVGKQVRVTASYTDGHGTTETVVSNATGMIANVNDAPTGVVTITGTATQNQTLTAGNSLADSDGLGTISYKWQVLGSTGSWTDITGAVGSTFTLAEAQVGKQVRVTASYTDGHGTLEEIASYGVIVAAFQPNLVSGTSGNDYLYGLTGKDTLLSGLGGNDNLYGSTGNDTLAGGTGNDYLSGGTGNDSYLFNLGDGIDTIQEQYGASYTDVLKLGAGIKAGDITVNRSGNSLVLNLANGTDKVYLDSWTYGADYRIDRVDFADGTNWSQAQLQAWALNYSGTAGSDSLSAMSGGNNTLSGLGGNDSLYGSDGNDTLAGGTGNDYLSGGTGNDSYLFNLGDGIDTIQEQYGASYTDVLKLGAGIKAGDITVNRSGNSLVLNLANGTDKVYLDSWTYGADYRIDRVDFADGTNWSQAQLQAWALNYSGTAGSDSLSAMSGGNNTLSGLGGNDYLYGSDGNDTLIGGTGTDTLNGSTGNDTYLFARGDGQDTVYDYDATAGNQDIARFGAGISYDQLWLKRTGNDLEASIIGTTDKVTMQNWYSGQANHIERFEAGGKALLDSKVDLLVQAMAAFAPPSAGQTSLPANYQTALAPVLAANWQ
jgi:Ca2+-binding RTX toxin-like protein